MKDFMYFILILVITGVIGSILLLIIYTLKLLVEIIIDNIRTDKQIKEWEKDQKEVEKSGISNLMNMY